jgi:hypothetical protein
MNRYLSWVARVRLALLMSVPKPAQRFVEFQRALGRAVGECERGAVGIQHFLASAAFHIHSFIHSRARSTRM